MSKETEKVQKALHQFIEENSENDMSEDKVNALIQDFMMEYNSNLSGEVTEKTAKTADDYLDLAEYTNDRAKMEKYIKKALELEMVQHLWKRKV